MPPKPYRFNDVILSYHFIHSNLWFHSQVRAFQTSLHEEVEWPEALIQSGSLNRKINVSFLEVVHLRSHTCEKRHVQQECDSNDTLKMGKHIARNNENNNKIKFMQTAPKVVLLL